MKKKIVTMIGLSINTEKELNETTLTLPEGTEILSVSAKLNAVWFTYMSPSDAFNNNKYRSNYPWKNYCFLIVKCNSVDIEIDEHKYIGNIDIEEDTYAVFYKAVD